jgi:putative transposase
MKFAKEIDITESPEALSEMLEQEQDKQKHQKLRTIYLLKTQKVKTLTHIAQILGRHSSTIELWIKLYREGGLNKLLENKSPQLFSEIPDWAIEQLLVEFKDEVFLPKGRVIQEWIEQKAGIKINYNQAIRLINFKIKPEWERSHSSKNQDLNKIKVEELSQLLETNSEINTYFDEWKKERGFLNNSQALNQLMGEFFGKRAAHGIRVLQQPGISLIESIAKEPLKTTIPHEIPDLLSQQRLSERLQVNNATLSRCRDNRTFPGWTKQRDPDGVGWRWSPELEKYKPLLSQKEIQETLFRPTSSTKLRKK